MIYLLMLLLSIMTVFSYRINKGDVLAPSFAFSVSFLFSAMWAAAYAQNWSFTIHSNTFFVIFFGVLEFIIVSQITSNLVKKTRIKRRVIKSRREQIVVDRWKLILIIIIGCIAILLTIYYKLKIMGGSRNAIMKTVMEYRKAVYASDEQIEAIPTWLGLINTAVKAGGFFFGYMMVNNHYHSKKRNIYYLLIVSLCVISGILGGGRGGIIDLIVCIVAFSIMNYYQSKGPDYRFDIGLKRIIGIMVIAAAVVFSFQQLGRIAGRESSMRLFDYLAEYIGAEIVNLDIFLESRIVRGNIWGSQTFINLIRWIGPTIGIDNWYYQLDHPFHYVNGYNLGNVATIFHPFIYDFGYLGVVTMTGIMAIISQIMYEKVRQCYYTSDCIISKIVYSYMYSTVLLSFFSNKFYEKLLNKGFAVMLVCWGLYRLFIFNVSVKKRHYRYRNTGLDI